MAVIVNIVLVGKLNGKFHIEASNSKRFNGSKIKLPECTCLLFPNGAVTLVGVKSFAAIGRIQYYLSSLFPNATLEMQPDGENLRVCNIVASADVGCPVDLKKLYEASRSETLITYTPETFPGMTIKLREKLVATVFYSGKFVITGAKNLADITFAEETIIRKIQQVI